MIIGDISYGLNFQINWGLILSFNSPLSIFIDDVSWDIATFPDYTGHLLDSPGKGYTIETGYTTSSETTTSETTTSETTTSGTTTSTTSTSSSETPTDGEAGTSSLLWIFSLIGISLIGFQKRKGRNKD